MTARLPTIGNDVNNWGTILNGFLQVGHNASGTLSGIFTVYNVKDDIYGAKGDGITDDTAAIAAANTAANIAGGGILFFPPGIYITGNQTLYTKVNWWGCGFDVSVLQLKAGTNADLLSANTGFINLAGAFNSGNTGGVAQFSLQNITLDGNKANQSAGPSYCMHFYGYAYTLHNVRIKNGYSGGILCDWNGGINAPSGSAFYDNNECIWNNVKIHDTGGIGLEFGGPHDSIFSNIEVFDTTSHNLHLAPNGLALLISNSHFYSATHGNNALSILCESSSNSFNNCAIEGSDVVQIALLDNGNAIYGGRIFSSSGLSCSGIQIGQLAGNTPYPGMIKQSGGFTQAVSVANSLIISRIATCEGPNGSLWLANDNGGYYFIQAINSTGVTYTGTPAATTQLYLRQGGNNQTSAKKNIALTGQDPGNGGTIAVTGYEVIRINPGANRTGVIVGTGLINAQEITIINISAANSIQFAVQATSHVALGAITISALGKLVLTWDATSSLWY